MSLLGENTALRKVTVFLDCIIFNIHDRQTDKEMNWIEITKKYPKSYELLQTVYDRTLKLEGRDLWSYEHGSGTTIIASDLIWFFDSQNILIGIKPYPHPKFRKPVIWDVTVNFELVECDPKSRMEALECAVIVAFDKLEKDLNVVFDVH